MKSIRMQILLLTSVSLSLILGFWYLVILAYNQANELETQLISSYLLVQKTSTLHNSKYNKKTWQDLTKETQLLTTQNRKDALKRTLHYYKTKQKRSLKKHIGFFKKNEQQYQIYLAKKMAYLKRRISYYGIISIIVLLVSLMTILVLIQKNIFSPLADLTERMINFLDNEYTFKYLVPAPSEIGKMQSTFNALAQNVLTNLDELKALDLAKSEFLNIASHELRTPLTSIKGSLALLNAGITGELPPQSKKLIDIADIETNRLIRLINDILDLAKIESRKQPLDQKWILLNAFIQHAVSCLDGLAASADVKMNLKTCPNIEIYCDEDRVLQVITNLLSNAIKYSPPNEEVTIHCKVTDESHLSFNITDQGKGIPPEDQEKIFEKFSQSTGPDNPLVKGTGLGLAIAQALVEDHGGSIGVRSTPGRGSCFYFTLPQWRDIVEDNSSTDYLNKTGAAA